MEFLLLILAWLLKAAFSPFLIVYGLIRCPWIGAENGYKDHGLWGAIVGAWLSLAHWFGELATVLDQVGNVLGMHFWNDALKKPDGGYAFGDRLDTMSFAMGMNQLQVWLSKLGGMVVNVLAKLDQEHSIKAVKKGIKRLQKKLFDLDPTYGLN